MKSANRRDRIEMILTGFKALAAIVILPLAVNVAVHVLLFNPVVAVLFFVLPLALISLLF
jgi:hypothetical protein